MVAARGIFMEVPLGEGKIDFDAYFAGYGISMISKDTWRSREKLETARRKISSVHKPLSVRDRDRNP
jgi:L-ribulose-5-phosphate 3-epimerase UlaE